MNIFYDSKTKQLKYTRPEEISFESFVALEIFTGITNLLLGDVLGELFKPGSLKGDDAENIETIIKAGKENNVDKMEIELEREVVQGLDLKALEIQEGINITLGQKGKSRYGLKIKYR